MSDTPNPPEFMLALRLLHELNIYLYEEHGSPLVAMIALLRAQESLVRTMQRAVATDEEKPA